MRAKAVSPSVPIDNGISDFDPFKAIAKAIEQVPLSDLPAIIGELEKLKVIASSRLVSPILPDINEDSLLNTDEAAKVLGVSTDWLYSKNDLPFIVRPGPGQRRYSRLGIQKWIKRRMN